jgi:protein-S-isoprenylcysteine O-methyltransferase
VQPYFYTSPVAAALFIGTVIAWRVVDFRQSLRRRSEATGADRGSLWLLVGCISFAVVAAILGLQVRGAAIGFPAVVLTVALAITWAGIALRWWAFASLGRYFTFSVMTSVGQPVVANGPYRLLRHPGYAGLELALIGVGAAFGNWISLASLSLIPLVGMLARIRVEESALSTTLGDAYRSYADGRKRLIPFIW